ncbi:1,4-alpha-glucan branching enzyme, partial [Vibrio sp. V41_P2S12T139]|nr:1,4-alpha-glucan branching enzyme [Vibrio sp. V41_P2S12T139]
MSSQRWLWRNRCLIQISGLEKDVGSREKDLKTTKTKKIKKQHERAYELLAEAAYSDPFAALGPFIDDEASLRVWMPGANKVELLVNGEPRVALER